MDAKQVIPNLEALGRKLNPRIFTTRVVQPRQEDPFLRVVNTHGSLAEDIRIKEADGEPCFMWSWGNIIAPVRLPDSAADRVAYVLTPQGIQG